MHRTIAVPTPGRGLHDITREVGRALSGLISEARRSDGLCCVAIQHTSASLLIQENADPSARRDLEAFFDRVAPDGDPRYEHNSEGPDDMPAHIRAALTRTTECIPVIDGELALGVWQGIYVFEHRHRPHTRRVIVSFLPSPS